MSSMTFVSTFSLCLLANQKQESTLAMVLYIAYGTKYANNNFHWSKQPLTFIFPQVFSGRYIHNTPIKLLMQFFIHVPFSVNRR